MIVLSKKRIIATISMVFVALFAFVIQRAEINKTVETVSLPVTNKVIVIDAGHGVPDEGAQSSSRNNRS
ncbi:MAG: hypothetical protein HFJ20_00405 [Clostridia bacterium]|nr:hypothetical protein [Clostridia bacterium]